MRTARFWTYLNHGLVKLSLKPKHVLTWHKFERDEEGWSAVFRQWHESDDGWDVEVEIIQDGVDCDGRLKSYQKFKCARGNLASVEPHPKHYEAVREGITFPLWEKVESEQRDYAAEAMGY